FPGVEEISAAPVETPPTNERRLEVAPVADETSIAGDLATHAGGPATIEDVGSPAPPEPTGVDELVVEPVNIGEPIVEMLTPDESAANVAVHEVAGETVQVGEQIAEGASGGESLVEVANLVEQAPAAARVDQRIAEAGIVVSRVVETETIDEQVMPATPVASQAVEAATLEERTPEPATGDEAVVRAQSDQADPSSSVLEIRTLDAQTIDRIMNQPAEPELDSILAIIAALRQERPPLQEDRRAIVEPKTIPVPAPVDEGESGPRLVTKATAPRKRSRRRRVKERKPDSTAPLGQMTAAPAEQAIRAGSGSRTGTKLRLKPPSEGPGGRSDEASLLGTTRTSFTCDDVGLRGWLAPLAKWTRRASDIEWHWVDPNPPRPKEDDVQALLKGMGVPYHVAGVTYGTGCRIGRVRVRRRGRKTSDGPLIILSRRTLAELRAERQSTLGRASR
ncbi:MAG: hypothetical protein HYX76_02855, partial [Acidobacteria bacterium]|nr:hypothetical protein [Acidobacteriota bacterium]